VNVACVTGAATRPGRLAAAMEHLAGRLEQAPGVSSVGRVDLYQHRVEICDGRSEEDYGADTRGAIATIASADAVVFGSPVYRATYPGALKNLLDHLSVPALQNKPVGVVAIAASDHHFLGVDSHMRFVLAWFGALTLPNSVYLKNSDFEDGVLTSDSAREDMDGLADALVTLGSRLGGVTLGPTPLAAKPW
jgi:FMN reductase